MSTKRLGRIVGALFLVAFAVYGQGTSLVDSATGTPPRLAGVAGSQPQIAAGVLLMVANSVAVVSISVLMFPLLRRRHEMSAYAYLITRAFEATILAVGALLLLLLIPLSQASAKGGANDSSSLAPVAQVLQQGNTDAEHIAMIGLGLGSFWFCRALLQARLVPKSLAVLGMVGYPILAAGEALSILGYSVEPFHYIPGGVFEIVLGVLLLVTGFRRDPALQLRGQPAVGTGRTSVTSATGSSPYR